MFEIVGKQVEIKKEQSDYRFAYRGNTRKSYTTKYTRIFLF